MNQHMLRRAAEQLLVDLKAGKRCDSPNTFCFHVSRNSRVRVDSGRVANSRYQIAAPRYIFAHEFERASVGCTHPVLPPSASCQIRDQIDRGTAHVVSIADARDPQTVGIVYRFGERRIVRQHLRWMMRVARTIHKCRACKSCHRIEAGVVIDLCNDQFVVAAIT
ncbi:hypothetical protein [Paraburkholderia sp. J94]|uniref:hypothetical protein n=1 Tax=Paraburkholderia sp. J94 TaxID=2805441 RepID=UPI002AB24F09|nr:hypothetical protein [Paraburkholderia sp. J94]